MDMERLKVAVRVLDAFCEFREPRIEDAIALRQMAESQKEQHMQLSELACAVIDRERAKYKAAGLTLPRFAL
jgi:hypothetical protein